MRKRSSYRPKGVILDTMRYVVEGLRRVDDTGSPALTLRLQNHSSLESILKGTGSRDDVDVLIASMNMAEALAMKGLGEEYRAEITAAQNAILAMAQRGLDKSRFLFTGPEMQAMRTGMEVHDAQLDVCTVAELERAMGLVEREMRAKRARLIVGATRG